MPSSAQDLGEPANDVRLEPATQPGQLAKHREDVVLRLTHLLDGRLNLIRFEAMIFGRDCAGAFSQESIYRSQLT